MRITKFLFAIILIYIGFSLSCAITSSIKNRMPPPHKVDGGILFKYENSAARQVQICGNFNNWCGTKDTGGILDPSIGMMFDDESDGIWETTLDLPPGRYQYKFVIDRVNWTIDPSSADTDFEDGIENSMVIVK
ncbi:glycogen-binding domain-containing protein [bacterium]|nr:glycogen-binding domain-containing protein [bacterium]